MRELPAVAWFVIQAVHVVDDIRCAARFEGTENVAIAHVARCQGIVAAADIGNQVIEYLLAIFLCREAHINGNGVGGLAVAVVRPGDGVPILLVERLLDVSGKVAVAHGVNFLA